MSARTFSVRVETRHAAIGGMVDVADGVVVIEADPLETDAEGGARVSLGFPALLVTGWVKDPEPLARRVAELLAADEAGRLAILEPGE